MSKRFNINTDFPYDIKTMAFIRYSSNFHTDNRIHPTCTRTVIAGGYEDHETGFHELVSNYHVYTTNDLSQNSNTNSNNKDKNIINTASKNNRSNNKTSRNGNRNSKNSNDSNTNSNKDDGYNCTRNRITYKSFARDYDKLNANLSHIGLDSGECVHCFFTKDNRNIIVFDCDCTYNVYNIIKDKWLCDENNENIEYNDNNCGSRSLLINDEIIVISHLDRIYFYSIITDIKNPILIKKYTIQTRNYNGTRMKYHQHGMCCINFNKYTKSTRTTTTTRSRTSTKNTNNMRNMTNTCKIREFEKQLVKKITTRLNSTGRSYLTSNSNILSSCDHNHIDSIDNSDPIEEKEFETQTKIQNKKKEEKEMEKEKIEIENKDDCYAETNTEFISCQIILFGGTMHNQFIKSFLSLDITINVSLIKNKQEQEQKQQQPEDTQSQFLIPTVSLITQTQTQGERQSQRGLESQCEKQSQRQRRGNTVSLSSAIGVSLGDMHETGSENGSDIESSNDSNLNKFNFSNCLTKECSLSPEIVPSLLPATSRALSLPDKKKLNLYSCDSSSNWKISQSMSPTVLNRSKDFQKKEQQLQDSKNEDKETVVNILNRSNRTTSSNNSTRNMNIDGNRNRNRNRNNENVMENVVTIIENRILNVTTGNSKNKNKNNSNDNKNDNKLSNPQSTDKKNKSVKIKQNANMMSSNWYPKLGQLEKCGKSQIKIRSHLLHSQSHSRSQSSICFANINKREEKEKETNKEKNKDKVERFSTIWTATTPTPTSTTLTVTKRRNLKRMNEMNGMNQTKTKIETNKVNKVNAIRTNRNKNHTASTGYAHKFDLKLDPSPLYYSKYNHDYIDDIDDTDEDSLSFWSDNATDNDSGSDNDSYDNNNNTNEYKDSIETGEKILKIIKSNKWFRFGYDCMLNSNNEAIIIIVGGWYGNYLTQDKRKYKSILLYNTVTNEINVRPNVKFVLSVCFLSFFFVW